MNLRVWRLAVGLWLCACLALAAAEGRPGGSKGGANQPKQNSTCLDVPAHPIDVVLCRPTSNSVTVSVLAYQDTEGCIAYGTQRDTYLEQTSTRASKKGEAVQVVLGSLRPDTQYVYQLRRRGTSSAEGTFHTARPPGSAFTFTVTADSHLDQNTDPALYQRTLATALADASDFHIDLGDTFMTEKHENRENAARQYRAQRFYFGQLCRSAPLFLVLGNHDGEERRLLRDGADSLAVWANMMRKRYFPNPVPDGFYTGNATQDPLAGVLQDYYAWEWGDALFVVLDPYWFGTRQRGGGGDNWNRTLGAEQYQWLRRTLETSRAKFKFIFIHQLVGGAGDQGRGGAEAAPFYEWGGRNADGSDGFRQHRPGWAAPIHQLLVENRVSVVFHGHDHFYAKQELDGIVYQAVPQPGYPGNGQPPRSAAEYGYVDGTILGSSGHLRVLVSALQAKVDYVHTDGVVAHSYSISPGGKL
jgi:predicted phosphodiesterase